MSEELRVEIRPFGPGPEVVGRVASGVLRVRGPTRSQRVEARRR